jgi:hypothetical protein
MHASRSRVLHNSILARAAGVDQWTAAAAGEAAGTSAQAGKAWGAGAGKAGGAAAQGESAAPGAWLLQMVGVAVEQCEAE